MLKTKSKNKLIRILFGTTKELVFVLPVFFIAIVVGVLIEMFIPDRLFEQLVVQNIWLAIPLAAVVGVVLPIPRYATYPIAFALYVKGAGFGVVFALISGEVIVESIIRDIVEIRYFGWKFFTTRLVVSIFFITLGGYLIEAFL